MALGAIIVVIVVASGEGEDPSTRAAARAAQESLVDSVVVVRELEPDQLGDDEARKVGVTLHADAVAVVSWRGDLTHRTASLHVLRPSPRPPQTSDAVVQRSFVFSEADPLSERGKTIGFTVASIVRLQAASAPPPPPTTPPERKPEQVDLAPPSGPPPEPRKPTMLSFDLLGAAGAFGRATGAGAEAGARVWLFDQRIAPHLGFGARFGEVDSAGASLSVLRLGLGASARFVTFGSGSGAVTMGARADGLLLWHRLSRTNNTSAGVSLVGGTSLLFETGWRFAPPWSLVFAVGAEIAFGDIRVFVDERNSTTILPLRGVGELGLRWEL